jgi:hypothetical protein
VKNKHFIFIIQNKKRKHIKIKNRKDKSSLHHVCFHGGLFKKNSSRVPTSMSLIINQAKVCVTWGWVYYVIGTDVIKVHDVIQPMSIKFVVSLRLMSLGLSLTYIFH